MKASATIIIDDSPAGSWRNARNPEGASCAACRQNVCEHSDLVYQGVLPPPEQVERGRAK